MLNCRADFAVKHLYVRITGKEAIFFLAGLKWNLEGTLYFPGHSVAKKTAVQGSITTARLSHNKYKVHID